MEISETCLIHKFTPTHLPLSPSTNKFSDITKHGKVSSRLELWSFHFLALKGIIKFVFNFLLTSDKERKCQSYSSKKRKEVIATKTENFISIIMLHWPDVINFFFGKNKVCQDFSLVVAVESCF
jgi:hypothetical protein